MPDGNLLLSVIDKPMDYFSLSEVDLYFLSLETNERKFVTQSCPTLCDSMDCSLPGSSVHGTLQVGILEWVVIPFSRESSRPRDQTQVSCVAGRFFTS